MDPITLARMIKETGISIGAFLLCAWMVVYIVKNLVKSIDKMLEQLKFFMSKVKTEHEGSSKEHEAMMKEHKEMIIILGRINGFKE